MLLNYLRDRDSENGVLTVACEIVLVNDIYMNNLTEFIFELSFLKS